MADVTKQLAYPVLGSNRADRISAALRALTGMVPFAGPILAEIVTEIVPNQRLDRIEKYLHLLAGEMERRGEKWVYLLSKRMKEPENVDLIEDGAYFAARALSDQRMRYVVQCVANGIDSEDRAKIHHKRLLSIIGELDDEEIMILDAFGSRDPEKLQRVRPEPATQGAPPQLIEANALHDAAIAKLERLSLVAFRQQWKQFDVGVGVVGHRPEKIIVPAVDSFGGPQGHREITVLGRLVLRSIGLQSQ